MRTSTLSPPAVSWLNRNVVGMTVTSFLSDLGHEMVTAVLPGFLGTIGVAAAALGWIEGIADASSSFIKLAAGWFSDRIGRRKQIVLIGYFLTGTGLSVFAWAASWPLVLGGRAVSWFGRGIRGPLRDAMLAESVPAAVRGKAFGLHRAGDTAGAIVGPLIGVGLLSFLPASIPSAPFRTIFLLSLIPGLASVVAFALLVREKQRAADPALQFWSTFQRFSPDYKRFLAGVGLFGMGDFSHTLLILAVGQALTPAHGPVQAARIAALLYVIRNVTYAAASFPVGMFADRVNKQALLAAGYALGAITALLAASVAGFAASTIYLWAIVFLVAGVYMAAQDALEGAIPADLVGPETRGAAYGLLGTVNGAGDLVASALVGTVWTWASQEAAFLAAGALMALGAALMMRNRHARAR